MRTHRGRNGTAGISHQRPFVANTGKPKNLPRSPSLRIVACPECKAGIGQSCVTVGGSRAVSIGTPVSTIHTSRRRIALRAHRENQENAA